MSATRGVALLVAAGAGLLLVLLLLNHFDETAVRGRQFGAQLKNAERAALAPDWEATKRLLIRGLGVGGLIVIIGVSLGVALLSVRHPLLVRDHAGVFPGTIALTVRQPVGNHQAHVVKAGVSGPQRLPAASYRRLTQPAELPELPPPDAIGELDPTEALAPDLAQFNNVLLIGASGCGKTNAGWATVGLYRQALPGVEFLVCSMVSSKWPGMCQASEPAAMLAALRAVDATRRDRDARLAQAQITDVHQWDGMAALIVVLDEAESAVRSLSGAEGAEFKRLLDRLVNTGRNVNMGLLALSQTGDRDFFPKSILANAKIFIGRSGQWVPQAYGVNEPALVAQILHAARGRFYSLQERQWVSVPVVRPPTAIRLSAIYQPPLQLAADAEADGLGAADQPDGPALVFDAAGIRVPSTAVEGGAVPPAYPGIRYLVPGKPAAVDYDEALHRRIWAACGTAKAIKAIQEEVGMGYKGGSGFYLVKEVRRLGQAGRLPWREG